MNINKSAFVQFLNSIILKGDIESKEAVLKVSKNDIKVITKTNNNVLALRAVLKGNFEDIGEIGIGDLGLLRNFITSFDSEELQLTKTKNKLVLKSETEKVEIQSNIVNPEYIKIKVPEDKFDGLVKQSLGYELVLTLDTIKKIIGYSSTIKAQDIILTGKGKNLTLQLDELDSKIVASFELTEEAKEFKIKFQASYLINLLSQVKQETIISPHTNKGMYVKVENEAYIIEYMIAPIEIKE